MLYERVCMDIDMVVVLLLYVLSLWGIYSIKRQYMMRCDAMQYIKYIGAEIKLHRVHIKPKLNGMELKMAPKHRSPWNIASVPFHHNWQGHST